MSDNKRASNAILKGIKHLINKEIENISADKTYTGIIQNIKEDNLYDVLINGNLYTNLPSIFTGLKIYDSVKVKIPQGQYSQMYIDGKYNTKVNVPETLPNPFSLIFNGAVNAEYDGAKEVTVTIPSGGGETGTSDYNNLENKPSINNITLEGNKTLEELNIQPKGNYLIEEEDPTVPEYVKNISEIDIDNWNNKTNFSGDYNDLQNKPNIPTKTSELTNDSNFVSDKNYVHTDNNYTTIEKDKLNGIQNGAEVNVQSDWNETDTTSDSYIKNKPIIPSVPEYTIEEVSVTSGYLKTYQLKKDSEYIGTKINIPKDMVVSGGSVEVVKETGIPYEGAVVGDKYIDLIIVNSTSSHIYIPVKELVDVYTAGTSISVNESNVISVIVDTSLSSSSVNPVQNKVIKSALDEKLSATGNASNVVNTFTQASTRANLTTGEKLSISLGKIMKWFIDLKTVAFSGNYNDLSNKPTSLPANGGNADSAIKLATPRKIAGTSFDGTADISISYNNLTDKPTIPSGVQVIDDLTSSSTTASLSANQGRILKGYVDKKVVVSSTEPSGQQVGDTWYEII